MGKIISISMVKNEADVIESFVRHTMSFVDMMLVADHSSTDKTPEILRRLWEEGLPLFVRIYAAGYVQVETMNALLREAAVEQQADLILPLDADEFLLSEEGAGSCREIVRQLDPDALYRLPWRLYEPVFPHEEESRFLLARPLRRGTDFASGQKVIIGGALYRAKPFHLSEGSHYGWRLGPAGEEKVGWIEAPHLHLAHFPWRSNEQYLSKSQTIWLNSIAKYSYETPTTLLSPRYWQIAAGEGEGCTFEGPSELVDLSPLGDEPALQYSRDVRPDPARRLLEVGTQIAAARAEERVLTRRRRVTIVLPCLGDGKALCQSLRAAYEQLYPYKEVFVLALMPPDETVRAAVAETAAYPAPERDDDFAPAEPMPVGLLEGTADDIFPQLSAQAEGDYVQWLFPGDQPQPDKITKMLACLELQDFPLSFALTNGRRQYADWLPWIRLPDDDRFQMTSPEALWRFLLTQGKYPACGIGGALFRREMMETRRWLADGFLGDRPLFLTMWRLLLTPQPGETLRQDVAILPHAYGQFPRDSIDLSDWIWHQIEWFCLLEQDRNFLGDEAYRQAHTWLQENAAVAAGHEADLPAELWKQYQAVLAQLGE